MTPPPGPHALWEGGAPHSALKVARVRALLTLQELADRTGLALGTVWGMEQSPPANGSDGAWITVARELGVEVAAIRPPLDGRQVEMSYDVLVGPSLQVPAMASSS